MLLEKINQTIKKYALIKRNDRILVGVSGGPDSVTLLYALSRIRKELNLILHVAHLDHALRKDSEKDADFVRNLAQSLNIPFTSVRLNPRALSKRGSLEEIARNARLEFFFKVAKRIRADKIALGHTLDDQAETVLMRILRGAGLYGLSAMLPKRKICGVQIIRPLIGVRRSEIEEFLKKKGIRARFDPSNRQDIYFRNKIRNKLLPYLEKGYNRNIREVLANMAEVLAADYDYLSSVANRALLKQSNRFSVEKLKRLHPSIRRLVFRQAIAKLKGDTRRITFQHIKEIEDLLFNRPRNSIVDLPKGISVIKKKRLIFYQNQL
ncbi:MAG: tRNA lysidine(34) synthetase TilS [Candidatus Omnitrophica bacterium]|nr:tRNA lysidine(34) synthetase TilS [Candidatus Omnitrophota bacterium]